jgi:hypothetical protein
MDAVHYELRCQQSPHPDPSMRQLTDAVLDESLLSANATPQTRPLQTSPDSPQSQFAAGALRCRSIHQDSFLPFRKTSDAAVTACN